MESGFPSGFLIVGLGNPGAKYARTRHNAGFLALERLGLKWRCDWRIESKFQSRISQAQVGERKVTLCQPQTYMNASGEAVAELVRFYKFDLDRLLVVVDDADLPLGQIRLRAEGSSGGHHGLESMESHLGSRNFARQRVGIGRREPGVREITGHVLGEFSSDEWKFFEGVLDRSVRQMECWMEFGIGPAMNQFNGMGGHSKEKETQ